MMHVAARFVLGDSDLVAHLIEIPATAGPAVRKTLQALSR